MTKRLETSDALRLQKQITIEEMQTAGRGGGGQGCEGLQMQYNECAGARGAAEGELLEANKNASACAAALAAHARWRARARASRVLVGALRCTVRSSAALGEAGDVESHDAAEAALGMLGAAADAAGGAALESAASAAEAKAAGNRDFEARLYVDAIEHYERGIAALDGAARGGGDDELARALLLNKARGHLQLGEGAKAREAASAALARRDGWVPAMYVRARGAIVELEARLALRPPPRDAIAMLAFASAEADTRALEELSGGAQGTDVRKLKLQLRDARRQLRLSSR